MSGTTGPPTELLVIRHGQSTWNQEKRWQGQADPPLSDFGRHQAQIAAQAVGQVDVIVSSPQIRAAETATIIAERVGVGPVQLVDGLQERNAGEWSGLTRDEIDGRWPGWVESERRPEGWEGDDDVLARTLAALEQVVEGFSQGTILVVCHGGVIINLERHLGVSDGRIPNLHGRAVNHHNRPEGLGELIAGDRLALIPDELRTGGQSNRV